MINGIQRDVRRGAAPPARPGVGPRTHDTPVGDADYQQMQDEIRRLAATNAELRATVRPSEETQLDIPKTGPMQALREENAALRSRVAELEQLIEKVADLEDGWIAKQKEYESLIDEKSEIIRNLHLKLGELEKAPHISKEDLPDAEELLAAQKELEEERQRMKEDEESMMQQMQQMELQMSKERADMARQRAEIQRLQADFNREVEIASRDPGLRDRLAAISRRGDSGPRKLPKIVPPAPQAEEAARPQSAKPGVKTSGVFKRLFGG